MVSIKSLSQMLLDVRDAVGRPKRLGHVCRGGSSRAVSANLRLATASRMVQCVGMRNVELGSAAHSTEHRAI